MFIYSWERERQSVGRGRGRERDKETQNPKQTPGSSPSAQSPDEGLEFTNCKIMIWAEVQRFTNWVTQVPIGKMILIVMFIQ